MINKKKVLLASLGTLGGLAAVAVAGFMVAGPMVYDAKLSSVLNLIEKRVSGLNLSYEETSSGLFSREGIVHWSFPLNRSNDFNLNDLSGSTSIKVVFAPFAINGEFHSEKGGTLDALLQQNLIAGFAYQGAFKVKALLPEVNLAVKTDNTVLGLEDGKCALGQIALFISASSPDKADLEFNAAGFNCKSDVKYAGQSAYSVKLEGLNIKGHPTYINKNININGISLGLADFYADFSTLYAIGFSPDDAVRDPSLREYFSVHGIGADFEIKDPDKGGFSEVISDGSGNLAFAFPFVEYGERQELIEFNDFKYNFSLGKINLKELIKVFKVSEKEFLAQLIKAVGNNVQFKLNNLSSSYKKDGFVISGTADALIDKEKFKVKDIRADFDVKSGKDFTDYLVHKERSDLISSSLAEGKITFEDPYYVTKFKLQNGDVTLNGVPFKAEIDD